jgi:hypothetical protein
MKKITLILASAALASTAFAISPKSVKADAPAIPQQFMQQQKMDKSVRTVNNNVFSKSDAPIFRADTYSGADSFQVYNVTTRNLLYTLGIDTDFYTYRAAVAVGGYKGETSFKSLTSGYNTWAVEGANSLAAAVAGNYTGETLTIPNSLYQNYLSPMLINGTDTVAQDKLYGSSFGGNAQWWGVPSNMYLGTCPTPWNMGGSFWTGIYAMSKDKTGANADYYDENGTYNGWYEALDTTNTITNIKLIGQCQIFPKTTTPYVVSQYYAFAGVSTLDDKEVELTLNIYPIIDNVISQTPIAKGSTLVSTDPKGYLQILAFDLVAVDEDGDEVDGVIAISDAVAVVIDIASDDITEYFPEYYESTQYPQGRASEYYDNHAYVALTYTDGEGAQQTGLYPCPYQFYGSEGYIFAPKDPVAGFDAEFPYVYNANTSVSDYTFNITLDDDNYGYAIADSYYDIVEMIEAGYMEASSDDDWFEYNISSYEESGYTFTAIEVQAEALPEGTEGRAGTINITGAGQDFTVTVIQGQVAGLSNVTVANNSASEYFDLQGRQLKAAPANGVYLQRQGNKVSKVIR